MEKRSRRRTRDLVTQAASQGLSENEIGCARISMMARSTNAPCKGRIQMRKTNTLQNSHLACNARPVHTVGSFATRVRMSASGGRADVANADRHDPSVWTGRALQARFEQMEGLVLRICIRPLHGAFVLLAIMDIRAHPISFCERP